MSESTPTHTLTTPKTKTSVEFRDWITGAEDETLRSIYLKARRIEDVALEADHKCMEMIITKVGDVTETDKIVAAVLALPLIDAKFIANEVKKIADPLPEKPDEASAA